MTGYPTLLFLHVLGATALLSTTAVEAAAVLLARRAGSSAQVQAALWPLAATRLLGPLSMLITLGSGGWMMARVWGAQPWLLGGIAALGWMALTGALAGRRLARLRQGREDGARPDPRAVAPALTLAWQRVAAGVAAVALMTLRPGAMGSAVLVGLGIGLGLLGSPFAAARVPGDATGEA
jgi:hypothetical protein